MSTVALLFQTGYLTIESWRRIAATAQYRLRYPNKEVRSSLTGAMLNYLRPQGAQTAATAPFTLYDHLVAGNLDGARTFTQAMFSGTPTDWHRRNTIGDYEGYYASVFYASFASLPLDVTTEDASSTGRLDMAVHVAAQTYLFEFKVVETEPQGDALQQIKDRRYADKYLGTDTTIHLVGIELSRTTRNIVAFDTETLTP